MHQRLANTNTERRVNLTRNVMPAYADSKPDFWIFNQMAKRFEDRNKIHFPDNTEAVFEEMKFLSKGEGRTLDITGMTYDRIEAARGIQWPYSEAQAQADLEKMKSHQPHNMKLRLPFDGNPRLYTDGVFQTPSGKAKLIPIRFFNNNECPDAEYPFWLNTGRVVEHFHTRTRTGKIGNQNKFSPTPYMEMNPGAAEELGIEHQSYVRLVSTAHIESKGGCGNPGCGTTGCGSKSKANPAKLNPFERPLWEIKTEEQTYAFLNDKSNADTNRYGQQIDLIAHANGSLPVGRSLFINENPAVGSNPNRNKQHGFFFTADNCIGCHTCEAACSEKNDNPAHIAFRSVGYVEGGSFPDYKRMNISMACNHCDDPVCLKGCPTRAYTKHVEYGAVLQDPETCFGCGYCTWVCPYNAPQLDPVKGQVSKCNMCVDRLEVGLKPACVAACNGNALDFGVIENIPGGREQARVEIPGFPSPEITRPNIRFQQIKQLPDEMKRTDSMPLKYHKDAAGRGFAHARPAGRIHETPQPELFTHG